MTEALAPRQKKEPVSFSILTSQSGGHRGEQGQVGGGSSLQSPLLQVSDRAGGQGGSGPFPRLPQGRRQTHWISLDFTSEVEPTGLVPGGAARPLAGGGRPWGLRHLQKSCLGQLGWKPGDGGMLVPVPVTARVGYISE